MSVRMIRRRALEAGIKTEIGCHTFGATGITAYLKNGGWLEIAHQTAAHESVAHGWGFCGRRLEMNKYYLISKPHNLVLRRCSSNSSCVEILFLPRSTHLE